MSYDLAVWEGPQPADDDEAVLAFHKLLEATEQDPTPEPTAAIKEYVAALLTRWPDDTDEDFENSPWSDSPLILNAAGNGIYFGMVWSKVEEAAPFAVETALNLGLVCFDPQEESLIVE